MAGNKSILILVCISAVILAPTVYGLKCYQCSAAGNDPENECHHADKISKDESKLRDCNGQNDVTSEFNHQTTTLQQKLGRDKVVYKCYKRTISSGTEKGKEITKRGCLAADPATSGECHGLSEDEKKQHGVNTASNVTYNTCECMDKDGCNSGEGVVPQFLTILAFGVVAKILG